MEDLLQEAPPLLKRFYDVAVEKGEGETVLEFVRLEHSGWACRCNRERLPTLDRNLRFRKLVEKEFGLVAQDGREEEEELML